MKINLFSFGNSILHFKKPFFTIVSILLVIYPIHLVQATEKEEPKQVLIFFSYPFGMPWQDEISKVIYKTFKADSDIEIEILAEYPDISQNDDDAYAEYLADLYQYKYKDSKIDIIIAVDTPASIFLLNYGDTLFSNVPIVSISNRIIALQSRMKPNWTGIFPEKRIKETIDTALTLQPKTKNIVVISGSSKAEKTIEKQAREIFIDYDNYFNFIYLTDIPMEQILEEVGVLPEHTIVLYLLTILDSDGNAFIPKEILKDITATANAPVYAIWDTFIGSGVMGGYMISTEVEGEILSDMAIQILKGQKVKDIFVDKDLNAYLWDWNQLKKWNINEENIPTGSIILNREYTFWDLYKKQILIIVSIVLLEAFLIFILLIQQSRLKTVRKSLTKSQKELENKVIERTIDLTTTNKKLKTEIIDHKEAKSQIQLLLNEKEIILKEVHHRIKNNMSTTMSLLSLQSGNLENPEAIEALETAGNRVRSMMLLYDKLYKGSNYQNISVLDYFTTLTLDIVENFENSGKITIETKIEDFQMDAKTVFNLGIIINELITNAMKYAFPGSTEGELFLSIETADNHVVIIVQDNGKGLPESVNIDTTKSFGLSLTKILTEQLNGTIKINRENGTKFILHIDN